MIQATISQLQWGEYEITKWGTPLNPDEAQYSVTKEIPSWQFAELVDIKTSKEDAQKRIYNILYWLNLDN